MAPLGEELLSLDFKNKVPQQSTIIVDVPIMNHEFMNEIEAGKVFDRRSFLSIERAVHARGDSQFEIMTMRMGKFKRYPDLVLYPSSEQQVEVCILAADELETCRNRS